MNRKRLVPLGFRPGSSRPWPYCSRRDRAVRPAPRQAVTSATKIRGPAETRTGAPAGPPGRLLIGKDPDERLTRAVHAEAHLVADVHAAARSGHDGDAGRQILPGVGETSADVAVAAQGRKRARRIPPPPAPETSRAACRRRARAPPSLSRRSPTWLRSAKIRGARVVRAEGLHARPAQRRAVQRSHAPLCREALHRRLSLGAPGDHCGLARGAH